jgi:hypothetical protein
LVEINGVGLTDFCTDPALFALQLSAMVRVYGSGGGDALGKIGIDGPAGAQSFVKGIRDRGRTFFAARTAPRAFVFFHIPGFFSNEYREISGLSLKVFHLAVGQKLNVGMSTDIQHLGRQDSDGAVVGGKSLVQLGHLTADTGELFHQVDLYPHIGKVQRRLDAGNAATDYEYIFSHHQIPYFIF